jgi:hypothetical protein
MVLRFVGGKHRWRKGRGFSPGELEQAGLKRPQARSFKIRTDERRSTVHAQNVAALKAFLDSFRPKMSKPEPSVEAPLEEAKPKKGPVPGKKKVKPRRVSRSEKPRS